jgi:hypothetical protein
MNETTPQLEPTEYAQPPTFQNDAFHERTTVNDNSQLYPYVGTTSIPPPPPTVRRRMTGVIAIILTTAAITGLMAGASYFAISHFEGVKTPIYAGKNHNITNQPPISPVASTPAPTVNPTHVPTSVPAQVVPTPTVVPTRLVPTPTVVQAPTPQPVDAQSSYNYIVGHLDSNHTVHMIGTDNNYSGWPYIPEEGALIWTDTTPDGTYTVEIAVFTSSQEAHADYQCMVDNQCSKSSYQGDPLQGTNNGKCLYMDNNYSSGGNSYSSYMVDELMAFDNVPGCI